MDRRTDDIVIKLTSLHRQEYDLQSSIKKQMMQPCTMEKVQTRIRNERKLKVIRDEIEQEEFKLQEARILQSLETK